MGAAGQPQSVLYCNVKSCFSTGAWFSTTGSNGGPRPWAARRFRVQAVSVTVEALSCQPWRSCTECKDPAPAPQPHPSIHPQVMEAVLGPSHPETTITLNQLGLLLKDQGRGTEAEALLRRCGGAGLRSMCGVCAVLYCVLFVLT